MLGGAGVIRPYGPRTLVALGRTIARWGTGPAGGFASLAVRDPDRVGLVDELGELTFGEMHRRSNALARGLAELGVGEGDSVAVMCRNHRGFVDASVAVAKLGADLLYLNTAFAGPQLVDVLEREQPAVVIHDEEFTRLLAKAHVEQRLIAWADSDRGDETIESLIEAHDDAELDPPAAARPDRDPHQRHDRHPQGRAAQRGRHRRRRLHAVADAAAPRLAHPHRGAAVPHVGLRPPRPGHAARLDGRAAPQVRPRDTRCAPSRSTGASRWSSSR